MINEKYAEHDLLRVLGERLRKARLTRDESQELFAQRLGMTRQSYGKMEKGLPQTAIGNWLAASALLGRLDGWEKVLGEPEDLFAQFDKAQEKRQRAGGRRKGRL